MLFIAMKDKFAYKWCNFLYSFSLTQIRGDKGYFPNNNDTKKSPQK